MSLFVLQLVALLTLAQSFGEDATEPTTDLSHLLSENDDDIKRVDLTDDRTLPRPTTPGLVFEPTPTPRPTSSLYPTETSKPTIGVGKPPNLLPQKPVALPPIASVIPENRAPVCGRKGRCYQWFDDEIEAVLNGYKRCSPTNERLAKRYCCIP